MRRRLALRLAACLVAVLAIGLIAREAGVQNLHLWPLLAERLRALQQLAADHAIQAAVLYVLIYVCVAGCGLPLGPPMSIAGGSLFGLWGGLLCAVTGATCGSLILFLVARSTIGRALRRRQDGRMERVRHLVERDGFAGLLALRVAPVVPGWLLNLAAALAHMRLRPFVAATMLGLLPATTVFTSIGSGLDTVLTSTTPPGIGVILRPSILLPLLCLSGLPLLPMIVRNLRRPERTGASKVCR
jgi:uncharacterized membrane protein YdjX (TVP38/TMEM64 family)